MVSNDIENNNESANLTTGPNRPLYQRRDDSFIFRQMPSFNRLSFEEVIDAGREVAEPAGPHRPINQYRNGQPLFEYLNN